MLSLRKRRRPSASHPLVPSLPPAWPVFTSLQTLPFPREVVPVALLRVGATRTRATSLAIGEGRPGGHPHTEPPAALWGPGCPLEEGGGGTPPFNRLLLSAANCPPAVAEPPALAPQPLVQPPVTALAAALETAHRPRSPSGASLPDPPKVVPDPSKAVAGSHRYNVASPEAGPGSPVSSTKAPDVNRGAAAAHMQPPPPPPGRSAPRPWIMQRGVMRGMSRHGLTKWTK